MFDDVFRGMRVLVTGDTGFKGSWLSLWLHTLGARVVGYALEPPTSPSLFADLGLEEMVDHTYGDVRDASGLRRCFAEHEPELVFHLAAQPIVRRSYVEPAQTYETNVMGTVNVLEAARSALSTRAIVVVTSDKCYENREWDYAYRENDPLGGYDPYSSSKGCAELVASAYRNSFFKGEDAASVVTVRAGNVIGGGDWAEDRIVPDCVRALAASKPIALRNPLAVRPWQHVLEPLSGYMLLGSLLWRRVGGLHGAWNFGPPAQSNQPVYAVAERAIAHWGSGTWLRPEGPEVAPHEAAFLRLDCTRANNLLGWSPVYGFDKAVEATVLWYRAYYDQQRSPKELALLNIAEYVEAAGSAGLQWAK